MNPLTYLVELVPVKYRKYAIYGPAALVMLACSGILGYDSAVDTFDLSSGWSAIVAGANTLAAGAFALAYKNTDVTGETVVVVEPQTQD